MKGSILPFTIAVLFIGCLAVCGQCRLEGGKRSYRGDHANTSANNATTTTVDDEEESKIHLKFCAARDCDTKGEPLKNTLCICCLVLPDVPCWDTVQICQDNCPSMSKPPTQVHA